MTAIEYHAIGVIHTPHKEPQGTPIQPPAAQDIPGTVEVWPEYAPGLTDLDGFSHIMLIYHFHLARAPSMKVRPFLDERTHGVFATRAPARPNAIGISVVRLSSVQGNVLQVLDVDIVDGTPLLDIKPYVREFDARSNCRVGWLEEGITALSQVRDDARFAQSAGRDERLGDER